MAFENSFDRFVDNLEKIERTCNNFLDEKAGASRTKSQYCWWTTLRSLPKLFLMLLWVLIGVILGIAAMASIHWSVPVGFFGTWFGAHKYRKCSKEWAEMNKD